MGATIQITDPSQPTTDITIKVTFPLKIKVTFPLKSCLTCATQSHQLEYH